MKCSPICSTKDRRNFCPSKPVVVFTRAIKFQTGRDTLVPGRKKIFHPALDQEKKKKKKGKGREKAKIRRRRKKKEKRKKKKKGEVDDDDEKKEKKKKKKKKRKPEK